MEWKRVHVEADEISAEAIYGFDDLKIGLDTDAESMHQNFLKAVPQLEEIGINMIRCYQTYNQENRKNFFPSGRFLSFVSGPIL